jgi:hypothetical protein
MRKLDEDIARVLDLESPDNDHNADKRDVKCSGKSETLILELINLVK